MHYLNEFQYSLINTHRRAHYIYKCNENMSLFTTSRPMQKTLQFIVVDFFSILATELERSFNFSPQQGTVQRGFSVSSKKKKIVLGPPE